MKYTAFLLTDEQIAQEQEIRQEAIDNDNYIAALESALWAQGIQTRTSDGTRRHPYDLMDDMNEHYRRISKRQYDYEDCIRFIERQGIKLFDYQKTMIRMMCENRPFIAARGIGRSSAAEAFGKYVAHTQDRNDYGMTPERCFPANLAIRNHLMSDEWLEQMRNMLTPQQFQKEFMCEWKT